MPSLLAGKSIDRYRRRPLRRHAPRPLTGLIGHLQRLVRNQLPALAALDEHMRVLQVRLPGLAVGDELKIRVAVDYRRVATNPHLPVVGR